MIGEKRFHKHYNHDLFKTRLAELMIEKGIVDSDGNPDHGKLYMALYPKGKRGDGMDIIKSNTTKKMINTIARAQYDWLRGEHYPASWEDMARLCNVLECDMDYLMGLESDYANRDEQFVCEYLGLSRNVVSKLHDMSLYKKWHLNDYVNIPGPGPMFNDTSSVKSFDLQIRKEISEKIINGIELIFTNKDHKNIPVPKHTMEFIIDESINDYSSILSNITDLCIGSPVNMEIGLHNPHEMIENLLQPGTHHIDNDDVQQLKTVEKGGLTLHEYGDYESPVGMNIDLTKYRSISLVDAHDDSIDIELSEIVHRITRDAIVDILKEMEKQFEKNEQK